MTIDIGAPELHSPVDLAEYLFRRLHQIGIRSVHGVPGDYNLEALDYVPKCGLEWMGNCNELNAGKVVSSIRCTFEDHLTGYRLCCRRLCPSQGDLRPRHYFRRWRAFGNQCRRGGLL
jgi:hypothetical protein